MCTLISDGPSDAYLVNPIKWLLTHLGFEADITWANPMTMGCGSTDLFCKVQRAVFFYEADVYFIHRDSENQDYLHRDLEIESVISRVGEVGKHIKVVPVRMSEAWFLHDQAAIRTASGNPRGTVSLNLPALRNMEQNINPKNLLEHALLVATELTGRRLQKKKLELSRMKYRVSELIVDFSPLEVLPAFTRLKNQIRLLSV